MTGAVKAPAAQPPQIDLSKIERQGQFIAQGKPGKIFVLASADMLKNMVIDENGRGPNTVFVLNAIDYLNQRGDVAVMRAKEQTFNPLSETSAGERTFIKSFIIAGRLSFFLQVSADASDTKRTMITTSHHAPLVPFFALDMLYDSIHQTYHKPLNDNNIIAYASASQHDWIRYFFHN